MSGLAGYVFFRTFVFVALAIVLQLLPPYLADASTRPLTVQTLACLAFPISAKLASAAMGRGALAAEIKGKSSLWRMIGVALLPVIPAAIKGPRPSLGSALRKLQLGMLKLASFMACTIAGLVALQRVSGSQQHAEGDDCPASSSSATNWMAWVVKPLIYYCSGLGLWLEVDGMGDLFDALAMAGFGITPEPHFDMPTKSESLGEFWAKRWNCTVSSLLRELAYAPVIEGRLVRADAAGCSHPSAPSPQPSTAHQLAPAGPVPEGVGAGAGARSQHSGASDSEGVGGAAGGPMRSRGGAPSALRRLAGLAATFLVSGVWHELVFAHMTGGHTTRGVWAAYFLVQAPLITAEANARKALRRRGKGVPRWLGVLSVNLALVAMVSALWMPPMLRPLPAYGCNPRTSPTPCPSSSLLDRVLAQVRADVEVAQANVAAVAQPAVARAEAAASKLSAAWESLLAAAPVSTLNITALATPAALGAGLGGGLTAAATSLWVWWEGGERTWESIKAWVPQSLAAWQQGQGAK